MPTTEWGSCAAEYMNELAGQSLGGYVLEEEIGRGSMGMVYRGKQIALGREVAIKVLPRALAKDASYVARFIREAQIIAGLNHPNIIHIYDAGQQGGVLFFVMEYVQGPTIGNLLQIDSTMPPYLAVEYIAQIADALDSAYKERNVIHRDIKPENLMLDRWGRIKVMDFGLARAPGHQQITVAKTLVGSIYYASPEQVWGHSLDNRSDIYALGVVLYEMVTGHRPFTGRTLPELTQAIVGGPLRPPSTLNPEIEPELERIILTAMARDREDRYEHAALMAQELRGLGLQVQSSAPSHAGRAMPVSVPPSTPGSSRQNSSREGVVIRPPRRPQAQRPRYLDLEDTQPPLGNAPPEIKDLPVTPLSPQVTEQNDDVPTRPLTSNQPAQEAREEAQEPANSEAHGQRWKQFQRFFKTPPEQPRPEE